MTRVLVLCTANQCRSVMTAALLQSRLAAAGIRASVRSAGLRGGGLPPSPEAVAAMAARGLDVSGHRSRALAADDLAATDLILAMAREHLRHAVVLLPPAWPRAFTLRELVRRGELAGARQPGEDMAGWLGRAHAGRQRSALLGDCAGDDIADPAGGPLQLCTATADLLDDLLARLIPLAWG
jgi:protein-tyrosine phosphatase